jgi:thymidine phosphorylase
MADGSAVAKYDEWIRAQGGDPDLAALPVAPVVVPVYAPRAGFVRELRAREVAFTALELGAGRHRAGDPVDHAVGVICLKKRGDSVEAGEPLAEIHAQEEAAVDPARAALLGAYDLGDTAPEPRPLVLDVIR